MADRSKYFTRDLANEGVILPIKTRDGKDEGDWFRVRGMDSDAFRIARALHNRRLVAAASLPPEEMPRAILESETRLTASLVSEWSLGDPFNEDEVTAFLLQSPQLMVAVDNLALNRARFFAVGSSSSPSMPKAASASTESQQVELNLSEKV